jgi:hypothetical protein
MGPDVADDRLAPARGPSGGGPLWMGPPANILGAIVPFDLLLAKSKHAAVIATAADVYASGWLLRLSVRYDGDDDLLVAQHHAPHSSIWTDPEDATWFRYGLEYGSGDDWQQLLPPPPELWEAPRKLPAAPLAQPGGASGTRNRLDVDTWVFPLPADRRVALSWEWPAGRIARGRTELDATTIMRAGAQAVELWPGGTPQGNQLWLSG